MSIYTGMKTNPDCADGLALLEKLPPEVEEEACSENEGGVMKPMSPEQVQQATEEILTTASALDRAVESGDAWKQVPEASHGGARYPVLEVQLPISLQLRDQVETWKQVDAGPRWVRFQFSNGKALQKATSILDRVQPSGSFSAHVAARRALPDFTKKDMQVPKKHLDAW